MIRAPHLHARAAARALLTLAILTSIARPSSAQKLDLSVNPVTVTFASADPDTVPIISSAPVQISYRVRQYDGPCALTIVAMGDLISGSSTVDISNVTWVATPAPPFENGTLSKTVAQRLASGTGSTNPARQGQITFRLANSWNYNAGLYTQTVLLTLSAP
jgi:hypothetical protein